MFMELWRSHLEPCWLILEFQRFPAEALEAHSNSEADSGVCRHIHCYDEPLPLQGQLPRRGLLDISTARYFYKVPKTILHKPIANSEKNILYNKCLYKHYLQLLYYILFCKTNSL